MPTSLPDPVVIFRDGSLLVVEKPAGLLAVPGRGADKQDCVVARLRHLVPGMIAQPAVHRLDMATSGLMIVAVTAEAHRQLSRQFETRQVRKRYTALLDGIVAATAGEIRLPFRLDLANRPYQIHDPIHGKMGITSWRRLAIEGSRTRVEFTPVTGRTHQLRVHAAHRLGLGIPIVGDRLYGRGDEEERIQLHASFLALSRPVSGTPLTFASPATF